MFDFNAGFGEALVAGLNPMNRVMADFGQSSVKELKVNNEKTKLSVTSVYEEKIDAARSKISALTAESVADNKVTIEGLSKDIARWEASILRIEAI